MIEGEREACFCITTRIDDPWLVGRRGGIRPKDKVVQQVEAAVSWVCWALFAYAERLDLPVSPFW